MTAARPAPALRLAACLYVRDDVADIAEWLAFHHVVGFDHILVFDNRSRDGTPLVVRRAAAHASITLIPWPVTDRRAQLLAYRAGLVLLRRFDWVAFLDSDEFLTPTGEASIKDVLQSLHAASGVAVNWAIFGSSGHDDAPDGLVIDAYRRRSPDGFDDNRVVKSIVRPRGARPLNPHAFAVPGPYVRPNGAALTWERQALTAAAPDYGLLQVSHYFTRSRSHWRRKMARGYRDILRPQEAFAQYDRNEVEDLSTARFAPAVHAELLRRGQGDSRMLLRSDCI